MPRPKALLAPWLAHNLITCLFQLKSCQRLVTWSSVSWGPAFLCLGWISGAWLSPRIPAPHLCGASHHLILSHDSVTELCLIGHWLIVDRWSSHTVHKDFLYISLYVSTLISEASQLQIRGVCTSHLKDDKSHSMAGFSSQHWFWTLSDTI